MDRRSSIARCSPSRASRSRCSRPRFESARRAAELIDLNHHPGRAPAHGRHRRGAVRARRGRDARRLRGAGATDSAGGMGEELGIPVFLYEAGGDATGARSAWPTCGAASSRACATWIGKRSLADRRISVPSKHPPDRRRHRGGRAPLPGRVQRQPQHLGRAGRQGHRHSRSASRAAGSSNVRALGFAIEGGGARR